MSDIFREQPCIYEKLVYGAPFLGPIIFKNAPLADLLSRDFNAVYFIFISR